MTKEQPKYLPLTKDIVFKQYFTSNKRLLLSLIKSFLPISDNVSDVVVLNLKTSATSKEAAEQQKQKSGDKLRLKDTSIPPHKPHGKQVVLDLSVKLSGGENVHIEMQVAFKENFLLRMLTYWAMLLTQDLDRGDDYADLNPTYSLGFTKFTVFKGKHNFITEIGFADRNEIEYHFNIGAKIVIVELNKFKKSYRNLVDMKDRWCYIIKHSADLTPEQVAYLSQDGETKMALEHLEEISKDEELDWETMDRRKYEIGIQLERRGALKRGLAKGRIEGMEAGRVQGMEAGRVEGMEAGRVQGMEAGQREIALNMLQKDLEVSLISEVTGLSVPEIKKLKR